ncbi:SH3 domain-containing protein (plasmid) [Streptomyces sp. NBC_00445]|uniref:SH3 domain-containing protein n=1 Tax=Streptomyces sp. NBC_00445 TaxID=2975745 RepID=UPI002E2278C6
MRTRKAITALSLTVALSGSGLVAVAGTAQAADSRCYITASAAKLRSKATTNSTALAVVYKSNRCSLKDLNANGTWAKLRMTTGNAKGKTGWVRSDLVHLPAVDTCTPPC